jgi:NAD-dependent deacetylase
MDNEIFKAVRIIKQSRHITAFTGAGISVESGIPPFRGKNGLWSKFDPIFLDIDYFHQNPLKSWKLIKSIFYNFFGKAKPNQAHFCLSEMENLGLLKSIITQNIDNLHQEAGSKAVYEFHGTYRILVCEKCNKKYDSNNIDFSKLPPKCSCGNILKPDFVFFGEGIPEPARTNSFIEAEKSDVFILIGTTGEIMPASIIPIIAKKNKAKIIEININSSNYTNTITDVFLKGKATFILKNLLENYKRD